MEILDQIVTMLLAFVVGYSFGTIVHKNIEANDDCEILDETGNY